MDTVPYSFNRPRRASLRIESMCRRSIRRQGSFNRPRRASLRIGRMDPDIKCGLLEFQSAPKGQSADQAGWRPSISQYSFNRPRRASLRINVYVLFSLLGDEGFNRPRRASLRIRSFVHAIRFFRGNSSLTSGLHWTWKIVSVIDIRTPP